MPKPINHRDAERTLENIHAFTERLKKLSKEPQSRTRITEEERQHVDVHRTIRRLHTVSENNHTRITVADDEVLMDRLISRGPTIGWVNVPLHAGQQATIRKLQDHLASISNQDETLVEMTLTTINTDVNFTITHYGAAMHIRSPWDAQPHWFEIPLNPGQQAEVKAYAAALFPMYENGHIPVPERDLEAILAQQPEPVGAAA